VRVEHNLYCDHICSLRYYFSLVRNITLLIYKLAISMNLCAMKSDTDNRHDADLDTSTPIICENDII
jgi:hypothetical protein